MKILYCENKNEQYDLMVKHFIKEMNHYLSKKAYINLALATGKSLAPFYKLLNAEYLPWERVNLYMVDEYVGIRQEEEESCFIDLYREFCRNKHFHELNVFNEDDIYGEIKWYNEKLNREGLDISVIGIGVDGHIGFNYPPANIIKKDYYIKNQLTQKQKQNHVKNGWFECSNSVPEEVVTLSTIGIYNSTSIISCAQNSNKKEIIEIIKLKQLFEELPVTYLCGHNNFILFVN